MSSQREEVREGINALAKQQIQVQSEDMDDIPWEELKEWATLPAVPEGQEVPEWRRRLDDEDGWRELPLFMEEIPDGAGEVNPQLAALQDVMYNDVAPDELAERCKLQGNEAMKMAQQVLSGQTAPGTAGPKGAWRTALQFYTEGVHAKTPDMAVHAALLANRAQVHLNLENYGHCVADCQDVLKLKPDVKCCFRAAKACNAVKKPERALQFVKRGLKFPGEGNNKALLGQKTVADGILARQQEELRKKMREQQGKVVAWQETVQLMRDHGVKLGRPELLSEHWAQYGMMAPRIDEGELHFSMLFIYDEHQQSDFVQDVVMGHSLADHIAVMFPPQGAPAPWDNEDRYHARKLTAFFQTLEDRKYHEVDLNTPFEQLLRDEKYVCPGFVPTFHVLPRDALYAQRWRRGED
eukprot:Hpha_TRINITY_DN15488_c3_g10::TRINITY_DN15488_c3_g10_i1::g.175614::m.175614